MTRTAEPKRTLKAPKVSARAPVEAKVPPESTITRRPKAGPARILPRTKSAAPEVPPREPSLEPVEPLPRIDFQLNDLAVHPSHGVGRIIAIEERNFGSQPACVYVLHIEASGLKVLIPRDTAARVGLRRVMAISDAEAILDVLRTHEVAVSIQPWNRRFRAYSEMMASGSPIEIAKVLRDMHRLKFDKELSFGERRLLDQSKSLLIAELGLSLGLSPLEIDEKISGIFAS
jgi:CarD family transcriptional regulator